MYTVIALQKQCLNAECSDLQSAHIVAHAVSNVRRCRVQIWKGMDLVHIYCDGMTLTQRTI